MAVLFLRKYILESPNGKVMEGKEALLMVKDGATILTVPGEGQDDQGKDIVEAMVLCGAPLLGWLDQEKQKQFGDGLEAATGKTDTSQPSEQEEELDAVGPEGP